MKHSYRPNEGENIFYSKSKNEGSCVDAALAWYNEIKDYRYANPGFSGATGHFTQVVWKDSTKVGVGIAHSAPDGAGFITTYIVAKYTPQGNFYQRGKEAEAFRANVASRKSGAKTPTRYEIDPSLCKDNSDAATCGNYKNWGFCQSYRSFIGPPRRVMKSSLHCARITPMQQLVEITKIGAFAKDTETSLAPTALKHVCSVNSKR